jgi:hypothetical protein
MLVASGRSGRSGDEAGPVPVRRFRLARVRVTSSVAAGAPSLARTKRG